MATPMPSREALAPPIQQKKRSRRARKGHTLDIPEANPQKSLLLDEIGDILVEQLCATALHNDHVKDNHDSSCISVMDHLNSSFKAAPVSSCASSSTYSTRTIAGSFPPPTTSLSSHEPLQYTPSQAPTEV